MSFLITALFGAAVERIIIRKLYGRTAETLLATYALSLIIKQLVNLICGSELKYVAVPFDGNISLFGVTVPLYNIFIIIITAAVLLITWIIFYKTPFGMEMRAATGNRSMAECLGINCRAVDTLTFAYGVGLAGLAGAVLAPIRGVSPFMGATELPWFGTLLQNEYAASLLGIIIPGALAAVLGYFIFYSKVKGIFFSLITMALSQIFETFFANQSAITNGTSGLGGLPRRFFVIELAIKPFYYLTVIVVLLVYALCLRLAGSR